MKAVAPRVKALLVAAVFGLLGTFFFGPPGLLLLVGSFIGAVGLLLEWREYLGRKEAYATGLGAVLDSQGVTLYGDDGPTRLPWSSFGEVRVSPFEHARLRHVSMDRLNWTGRERADATCSTPIDHLDMAPEELLRVLASHPSFRGTVLTPQPGEIPG